MHISCLYDPFIYTYMYMFPDLCGELNGLPHPPPNSPKSYHSLSNTVIMKTYGLLPDRAWIWLDFPDFKHDYRKEVYLSDVFCQPQSADRWFSQWLLIHPSHKCLSASDKYSTMHLFVTEMCTCAHSCYKVVLCGLWDWCIVGFVICEIDLFIGSCKIWQWY